MLPYTRIIRISAEMLKPILNKGISVSRSRQYPASAPVYLALGCVGLLASPAFAQDGPEAGSTRLGGVTVTDTALDDGQDYKVDTADSPKYTAPLLNTPKTVVVVPEQVIRENGATTFVEALRTVPGITFGAGEGGNPQGDRPFIRGFDAQGSTFIDGIRSIGGQSREIFAIEQIEVVKGGDSTMGGRGSAGGSLNLVSKMPHLGTRARTDLSLGTDDYKRATVDANYQIGDMAAIRLNGMWHDADVAKRDAVTYNRWGVSPSVALGLGTPTRAFVNYYHLESDDLPDPGMPFERIASTSASNQVLTPDQLNIGPAEVVNGQKVNRRNFYGLKNRDFRKTNVDELLLRVEHELSDTIQVRASTKYANNKQSYILSQPDDSQGNVQDGLVWRRTNQRWSDVDSMSGQLDFSGTFDTGSIGHSFSAGFEASWEQAKVGSFAPMNTNIVGRGDACAPDNIATYNCTSLFNPNPNDPWDNRASLTGAAEPILRTAASRNTEATTYALYAFDTVSLTDALLLNLGLRYDWYDTTVTAIGEGETLVRKDDFLNWQAGLVYKPVPNGSFYVSYAKSTTPPGAMLGEGRDGNGLSPGRGGADFLPEILKPEKTKSYEVGTKWELMDAALNLNLALFRTETDNARTTGETGLPEFVGERRIQGVEVGFSGRPLPFWNIFGGYTYMDSEVRYAGEGDVSNGKPFPNTPKHSFTLWTTVDIADRYQIGGGAIYNSRQYANFSETPIGVATRSIPGYWRFDATAAADITENVGLRVNVQNLTNKRYYDRTYSTHFATIAPGRSAFATLSLKY